MNIFSVYDAYIEKKTENYKVPFGDPSKCSFPTGDNVEGRPIINKNSVHCKKRGVTVHLIRCSSYTGCTTPHRAYRHTPK